MWGNVIFFGLGLVWGFMLMASDRPPERATLVHMVDGATKTFQSDQLEAEGGVLTFSLDGEPVWTFSTRHVIFVRFD